MTLIRFVLVAFALLLPLASVAAPCAGFSDVEDTDEFCANVAWIRNRNITLGCETGLYCPHVPVSRLAMAAFLNRLGNVLLPPNVVWVANEGGQFQSIQAAVDHVATQGGGTKPAVVKVAPGVYTEQLTIPPNIVVEGSGQDVTELKAAGACQAGVPTAGGLTTMGNAQLRRMQVSLEGALEGNCIAVMVKNGQGTVLEDMRVRVHGGDTSVRGVRVTGGGAPRPVVLDNVEISLEGAPVTASAVGLEADVGDSGAELHVRNSDVSVSGAAPVIGLSVGLFGLRLEGSRVYTMGGIPSVALMSTASVPRSEVRNSHLSAVGGFAIQSFQVGQLYVATSMLAGSIAGPLPAGCTGNYTASMVPIAC